MAKKAAKRGKSGAKKKVRNKSIRHKSKRIQRKKRMLRAKRK